MTNKNNDIQSIFNKLSEQNKDILILVATSVKVAQDINEQNKKTSKNISQVSCKINNLSEE